MGPGEFVVLAFAVIIGWKVFQFCSNRVPKVNQRDIETFQQQLPKGFGYPYFLAGTGYGINVPEGKIYLQEGNQHKIYDRDDLREIQSDAGEYIVNSFVGARGIQDHMDVVLQNRKNKKQAFENSGLFINVTDIDHPVWQIKISDPQNSNRCFEIVRQFMQGELKPYDEYVKGH